MKFKPVAPAVDTMAPMTQALRRHSAEYIVKGAPTRAKYPAAPSAPSASFGGKAPSVKLPKART
jgi:hypothetical protein